MSNVDAETDSRPELSPAIRRLQNKPEIPTIDFSVYKMDDGTVVSTKDRVIKGWCPKDQTVILQHVLNVKQRVFLCHI